jgi:4'-phosphopantetheinyl transferase
MFTPIPASGKRRMQPAQRKEGPFGWRRLPCPEPEPRLWLVDVSAGAAPPDAALALSGDEIARAARFRRAEDRIRFKATRGALRHLLAGETGLAPDALAFALRPHGKPALAGMADPQFNVSHAGGLALIGISARPIGVDIEKMEPIDELALAEAFFCAGELRDLKRLDGAARRAAFYQIWTCKEAVLKGLGCGIAENLKDFRVHLRPAAVALEPGPDMTPALAGVRAGLLDAPDGYAAAFALA